MFLFNDQLYNKDEASTRSPVVAPRSSWVLPSGITSIVFLCGYYHMFFLSSMIDNGNVLCLKLAVFLNLILHRRVQGAIWAS